MTEAFALVLHSHLPYARGAGRWPHGEEWVHEAILGTYLPLLGLLHDLRDDGVPYQITLGLTPTLIEQLADHDIDTRFIEYCDDQIHRADTDVRRFDGDGNAERASLARFYARSIARIATPTCADSATTSSARSHLWRRPATRRSSPRARRTDTCRCSTAHRSTRSSPSARARRVVCSGSSRAGSGCPSARTRRASRTSSSNMGSRTSSPTPRSSAESASSRRGTRSSASAAAVGSTRRSSPRPTPTRCVRISCASRTSSRSRGTTRSRGRCGRRDGLPRRARVSRVPPQGRPQRAPLLARHRHEDGSRREGGVLAGHRVRARARTRRPLRRSGARDACAPSRGARHERAAHGDVRQRALRTLVVRGSGLARPRSARAGRGRAAAGERRRIPTSRIRRPSASISSRDHGERTTTTRPGRTSAMPGCGTTSLAWPARSTSCARRRRRIRCACARRVRRRASCCSRSRATGRSSSRPGRPPTTRSSGSAATRCASADRWSSREAGRARMRSSCAVSSARTIRSRMRAPTTSVAARRSRRAGLALLRALALRRGCAGLSGGCAWLRGCGTGLRARGSSARLRAGGERRAFRQRRQARHRRRQARRPRRPLPRPPPATSPSTGTAAAATGSSSMCTGHGLHDELVGVVDDLDDRLVDDEVANEDRVVDLGQRREVDLDRVRHVLRERFDRARGCARERARRPASSRRVTRE